VCSKLVLARTKANAVRLEIAHDIWILITDDVTNAFRLVCLLFLDSYSGMLCDVRRPRDVAVVIEFVEK